MIVEGIKLLVENRDLQSDLAQTIMREIMTGKATSAQIAAFSTAMRMKKETTVELAAMASVMREFSIKIHPRYHGRLVDTCGTGGGVVRTFNVSTIAAFVTAGAGVSVAKHGNRSFTGASGSADLLEVLGFDIDVDPAKVQKTISEYGIGFMFAPKFHPAMKYASQPRREIAIRTIFNYLGPLTNPASSNAQLLGVSDKDAVLLMAEALRELGCKDAMIVHGEDGLDEFSTIGPSQVAFLHRGEIWTEKYLPKDLGLKLSTKKDLAGGQPEQNAEITIKILRDKEEGPRTDFVLANASAAIMVGGKVENLIEGIEIAKESLKSGSAYKKLQLLIESCGKKGKTEEFESRNG